MMTILRIVLHRLEEGQDSVTHFAAIGASKNKVFLLLFIHKISLYIRYKQLFENKIYFQEHNILIVHLELVYKEGNK